MRKYSRYYRDRFIGIAALRIARLCVLGRRHHGESGSRFQADKRSMGELERMIHNVIEVRMAFILLMESALPVWRSTRNKGV
jgi:hypothetical protein